MVISPQPLGPDDIWPGCLCVWLHTPLGGYGYTIRIPAKVVERHPDGRVVILAALASGGVHISREAGPTQCPRPDPSTGHLRQARLKRIPFGPFWVKLGA